MFHIAIPPHTSSEANPFQVKLAILHISSLSLSKKKKKLQQQKNPVDWMGFSFMFLRAPNNGRPGLHTCRRTLWLDARRAPLAYIQEGVHRKMKRVHSHAAFFFAEQRSVAYFWAYLPACVFFSSSMAFL